MASGSKTVIYAALAGNSLIAITKFIASAITGSSAMLSEAIHSLVDTGNQGLLLFGLKRSKRPPSEEFPYGHGKEIYFWSFVVAILIFALGAGISMYEGIKHVQHALHHPEEKPGDPTANYIVLALAIVFEGFACYFAWREFSKAKGEAGTMEAVRHGKDPTLFVVLFEDGAAMAGLLVALIGIVLGQVTGNAVFDGAASVAIGVILAAVAVWLAWETQGLLIGEAATRQTRRGIRDILSEQPGVEHINELLTVHMGPEHVLVTASIDYRDAETVAAAEDAVDQLNEKIKAAFPQVSRVFIEIEQRMDHQQQIDEAVSAGEGEQDDPVVEPPHGDEDPAAPKGPA